MGKGDKRTKKGKIVSGTFGKSRPKKADAKAIAEAIEKRKVEAGKKKTTTKKKTSSKKKAEDK